MEPLWAAMLGSESPKKIQGEVIIKIEVGIYIFIYQDEAHNNQLQFFSLFQTTRNEFGWSQMG